MRRFLILLFGLMMLAARAVAGGVDVAFYYGDDVPVESLNAFSIIVVEPDHGHDPVLQRGTDSEFFAYVSIGEVKRSRHYFGRLPEAWLAARNEAWDSEVIDQSAEGWPAFFADEVIAPLWARGYRGFFLDTMDSWRLIPEHDPEAQMAGLVQVIKTLHARFPGIRLISNRGFEVLPQLRDEIFAVAAESLYQGWNAERGEYVPVLEEDRAWLQAQLRSVRDELGMAVIVIDYVSPDDLPLMRTTARRILEDGFTPWVTDSALVASGIGRLEPVPRRVLGIINLDESLDGFGEARVSRSSFHFNLEMPLNYEGLVVEYRDPRGALPAFVSPLIYKGVVSWFRGAVKRGGAWLAWLRSDALSSVPLLVLDDFGMAPDRGLLRKLGLLPVELPDADARIVVADPSFGLEAPLLPPVGLPLALAIDERSGGRPLLRVDVGGVAVDAAAAMPWGGYVLDPFVMMALPGSDADAHRWIMDPFEILRRTLRLGDAPAPDVTSESGRRMLLAHIDGDGFPSFAEYPGSPLSGRVLLDQVLKRYPIPHAMSVIEVEVSPHGHHPTYATTMEQLARQMFALPNVEIASHTYSHPFFWSRAARGIVEDSKQGASLAPEGYVPSLEREIAGSIAYINERLAPPGKQVSLMLWSGDALPPEEALKVTTRLGVMNLNGGNTIASRREPTLTRVSPLGMRFGPYFQPYAPIMNENVYTNLWTGPYYGFRDVVQTFEFTESPRRLKPINIYYHTYSATKRAGIKALHEVYDWALAQPNHPVYPSEYAAKAKNFNTVAMARDLTDGSLVVRNADALRTLRLPAGLGEPDLARSQGIAGWRDAADGRYVHLSGDAARLHFGRAATRLPYLEDANGRVTGFERHPDGMTLTLTAHVPLRFALRDARGCRVQANGRALTVPSSDATTSYELRDASAEIQLRCG